MKKLFTLVLILTISLRSVAQEIAVYPSNWWTGMKMNKIQLILHSLNPDKLLAVDKLIVKSSSADFKIKKVNKVENKRYLILDVEIAPAAKPQTVEISFGGIVLSEWQKIKFQLKAKSREDGKSRVQGVTQADFIYLLMPDRFANGDPANDFFPDMRDTGHDRNNPFDRHGGDLKGIENNLGYLKDLGITAIWPTPVVENDMARTTEGGTSRSTYHGYAFTDQYTVDKRLGTNEEYKHLVNTAHEKGLKFIQDAVYNHVGEDHWSMKDMPMKDWVNQWPEYTNTSYKDQPLIDPYASAIDRKIAVDGWFTPFLADLNQRNPYVSNFLIQYAIWATEEFGIDGWRVDTYFYNDPVFLNKMNVALATEFPALTVFGETLVTSVINAGFFSDNNFTNISFKHNAPGITDFPLTNALLDGLRQPFGWSTGVSKLYTTLSEDIVYKDPSRNCIFLDNHDLDRVYSIIGEDLSKFKMGINWLLTLRGIPQLYYGTEILMKNFKKPTDAAVREDFPGGWKEDAVNKFSKAGRTPQENEAYDYVAALANFRKTSTAITKGRLMQYTPVNGVYIYFRYDAKQTVMVATNTDSAAVKPNWPRFSERINGFRKVKNVINGEVKPLADLQLLPNESIVFELEK